MFQYILSKKLALLTSVIYDHLKDKKYHHHYMPYAISSSSGYAL